MHKSALKPIHDLVVGIKGAGEMATGVAWYLYQANIRSIFMMEIAVPLAVRRRVSFCEAVHAKRHTVMDITAIRVVQPRQIRSAWSEGKIAVTIDPGWSTIGKIKPDIVVDAILAKKNLGTTLFEAPLVIGLGPGLNAGSDAHVVIETNRGHDLGRLITTGSAEKNTGIPGNIAGFTQERVLRAQADGTFETGMTIGDCVVAGDGIGQVAGRQVRAKVGGVLRGLLRSGSPVQKGAKLGDIDPRGKKEFCNTISDKARTIAGSVLQAILVEFNRPGIPNHGDVKPPEYR